MQTKLNPAGWVRLVLYVISALVGVGAVVATTLGYDDMAALLGTLAGTGAAVTGGTAAYNLPKAPDQSPTAGMDLVALLRSFSEITDAVKQYQAAHATTRADTPASALPVYEGETSAEYIGQHRAGE
ncbi:hypothetical protein [Corynebacterium dentalis]|uniref:hypothetical protein n=1 Tax=Corynebacterium dentalis TaxID=2014528 RepID=UPI00370D86BC